MAGGRSGSRGEVAADGRGGEAGGAGRRRAEEGGGAGSGSRSAAAMAQCVQSVQEFIQDSFVPLVAALCSEEAERLTRKNSLSFAELVKPFCRLTSEGRCRERSGERGLFTRGGEGGGAPPFRPAASRGARGPGRAAGAAVAAPPLPWRPARLSGDGRRDPLPGAVAAAARSGVTWSCDRLCGGTRLPGLPQVAVKSVLILFDLFFSVEPWLLLVLCGTRLLLETSRSTRLNRKVSVNPALPNRLLPFFKTTLLLSG